ncbi:hypothetical protein LRP67_02450 [Nocardioides sp. cx-169]|uniref:hypothetical protein n=1 Tax=Nocardioides sp. cx-169 TaxID=2899080 RepID=UPI001E57B991|nr:hypothetical protein [Nocardioides sp. cx-169]MCD4532942.1 hypothetical protein [Nocardioides sp. cx-169]
MNGVDGHRRAWGWVAHLRGGGTTPWSAWAGQGERRGAYLPGAQQLELLRRLNLAGSPGPGLVERVLAASAPGRGSPDLELVGADGGSAFGPRPVDPAGLPDAELTRVASSLLADDLVAAGTPPRRSPALVRPWRTRYRLVGDPWLADPVRDALIARGRPPGGRGSTILVLGTDLATMVTDAWTSRAFDDGGPAWREWLDPLAAARALPRRVNLERAAATWTERVGAARVGIVVDAARLPRLVGLRRPLPAAPRPAADAVDLARRVAAVLGILVLPPRRAELLRHTLLPRLLDAPGRPLAVPAEHADWVVERATRLRDVLLRAGYAVHGDPDLLVPRRADLTVAGAEPTEAGVLGLAVRLLLGWDRSADREEQR